MKREGLQEGKPIAPFNLIYDLLGFYQTLKEPVKYDKLNERMNKNPIKV